MKLLLKYLLLSSMLLVTPAAMADEGNTSGALNDAWLDGKLATVIVLNEYLNPFKIETDVVNGKATLTGRVRTTVHKALASELALGVEGITDIDNQLVVTDSPSLGQRAVSTAEDVSGDMLDVSISAAVSTKLMLRSEVDSSGIDVSTDSKTVTLEGSVPNAVQRDMAEQIALNTFQVTAVVNQLAVQ